MINEKKMPKAGAKAFMQGLSAANNGNTKKKKPSAQAGGKKKK